MPRIVDSEPEGYVVDISRYILVPLISERAAEIRIIAFSRNIFLVIGKYAPAQSVVYDLHVVARADEVGVNLLLARIFSVLKNEILLRGVRKISLCEAVSGRKPFFAPERIRALQRFKLGFKLIYCFFVHYSKSFQGKR